MALNIWTEPSGYTFGTFQERLQQSLSLPANSVPAGTTFTVISGALPPGLRISNESVAIIGTPGEKWRGLKDSDESIITAASKSKSGGYGIAFASTIPVTAYERIELGRSPVGMPLLVPGGEDGKGRPRFIYVHDEPRVALVAHLENGWSIINTHLSFVPGINFAQLQKLKRWAAQSSAQTGNKIAIIGDLNLPKGLPVVGSPWKSLLTQNTYPSWSAKIQFDYILTKDNVSKFKAIKTTSTGISDHLPITVEIE
jgi:hypothetical protein